MLFRTPFFLPWFYSGLLWRVPTKEKKVYLTFDDGPVPGPTEFVLELLKKHQAKATFFCIGDNVRKHPAIFRKVIAEGHRIGNHTFHHLRGWKYSRKEYIQDTFLCESQMKESGLVLNNASKPLFRPPYGRITRAQIESLAAYEIVMWDVLSKDYDQTISPEKILQGSIQATRPGSIVVFHDSLKAIRNLEYVLPRYLSYLKQEGYSFESL